MKKYLLPLLLSFILISDLSGSSWIKLHGRYVTLEFNPGYESLADSLVTIADKAIPKLCLLHGFPLENFNEKKTRIILTDAPDISNGYAIENAVVIYARSSMYLDNTSGPQTWYKHVLEHELVHHISFRAIQRTSNFFGAFASLSVPRWFMEGIAQYFAETWTAFRGDYYMREAVLNGRFTYDALFNLSDGRLLYASGHAFVRYLADQYGDSSFVKLFNYNHDGFFYDFDLAFRHVYGKTPHEMFSFFTRHMIIYYGNQAADYPVVNFPKPLPVFGFHDLQVIPLADADSTYLVSSVLKENHLYKTAFIVQIKDGHKKIIDKISDNFATKLFISNNQKLIVYGRGNYGVQLNQTSYNYEWYIYKREDKESIKIADNIRAFNAVFTDKNELILAVTGADETEFIQFDILSGESKTIFITKMAVAGMTARDDGSVIFEAQSVDSQRDLYQLKNGETRRLTFDRNDNRNPLLLDENHVVFNQLTHFNPSIAILDLTKGSVSLRINQQYPLWLQSLDKRKNELIVSYRDAIGKTLFYGIPVDSLLKSTLVPDFQDAKPAYSSWIEKTAQTDSIPQIETNPKPGITEDVSFPQTPLINLQTLPLPVYNKQNGFGLFFSTLWVEALQRQSIFASGYITPKNWPESFLSFIHNIKITNLNLTSFYYHGPGIITRINGEPVSLTHDYAVFNIGIERFAGGNLRIPYFIDFAFSADKISDKSDLYEYSFHGPSVEGGIGYFLPSRYQNIFPKKALLANIKYFKSIDKNWKFNLLSASLQMGTNIILEAFGINTRTIFTKVDGTVSPSAITGIDRDYQYNIPRDFRNTQTIRGFSKDIFGDELIWNSTDIYFIIAPKSSMKLLFLPVNELAISGFIDAARITDNQLSLNVEAYSFGSELSFGFGIVRFAAGYAQPHLDEKKLNSTYYGRINININGLLLPGLSFMKSLY